jgi:hypothetical protein
MSVKWSNADLWGMSTFGCSHASFMSSEDQHLMLCRKRTQTMGDRSLSFTFENCPVNT